MHDVHAHAHMLWAAYELGRAVIKLQAGNELLPIQAYSRHAFKCFALYKSGFAACNNSISHKLHTCVTA